MPATGEPEFQQLDMLGQLDPWADIDTEDPENVIQFPSERTRSYQEYLASPEWQGTRDDALHQAKHRCHICNSRHQLEVHHRTYERIGRERPDDLTVLCRPCHALFHRYGRLVRSA
jgi:5-methylcytosine-specific restriction endonuclease McrA